MSYDWLRQVMMHLRCSLKDQGNHIITSVKHSYHIWRSQIHNSKLITKTKPSPVGEGFRMLHGRRHTANRRGRRRLRSKLAGLPCPRCPAAMICKNAMRCGQSRTPVPTRVREDPRQRALTARTAFYRQASLREGGGFCEAKDGRSSRNDMVCASLILPAGSFSRLTAPASSRRKPCQKSAPMCADRTNGGLSPSLPPGGRCRTNVRRKEYAQRYGLCKFHSARLLLQSPNGASFLSEEALV